MLKPLSQPFSVSWPFSFFFNIIDIYCIEISGECPFVNKEARVESNMNNQAAFKTWELWEQEFLNLLPNQYIHAGNYILINFKCLIGIKFLFWEAFWFSGREIWKKMNKPTLSINLIVYLNRKSHKKYWVLFTTEVRINVVHLF